MFFSLFMITASLLIAVIIVFVACAADRDRRLNRRLAHRAEQVMPALYGEQSGWSDWRTKYGQEPSEEAVERAAPERPPLSLAS